MYLASVLLFVPADDHSGMAPPVDGNTEGNDITADNAEKRRMFM